MLFWTSPTRSDVCLVRRHPRPPCGRVRTARRRGRRGLHQLPSRPRSAQQQVAHVHLHLIVRLVVEQLEQQRQLASVLPNRQSRTPAVGPSRRTINESVTFTRRAVRPAARQAAAASRARQTLSYPFLFQWEFYFFSFYILRKLGWRKATGVVVGGGVARRTRCWGCLLPEPALPS